MFCNNVGNMSEGLNLGVKECFLKIFSTFMIKRRKVNWLIDGQFVVNDEFRAPKYQISSLESKAQKKFKSLTKKLKIQNFSEKSTMVNLNIKNPG